jgi:type I restriction enzyme S subunit
MEEWKKYKLGDILTIKYGKDHKQLADGKIPIYGSGGIMRYGDRYLSEGPSILIPRKGSLNNIMFTSKPFWTVDTMFWTIIDQEIANPLFVYYLIFKKDFSSLNVGTAVPSLTVPVIEDIDISLPSRKTQDNIVIILKSFDDKIECNRQINDNLEQQAQALFKSWFVDFEPFKDGEFVESEMGMIPKGWTVRELDEIIEISKQSINPNKSPEILFTHYSIPAYDREKQPDTQLGKEILSNKFVVRDNMTLFSKLNPRIKRIWYVGDILENSICSTEFVPFLAKDSALSVFVFSLVSSQGFYDYILSMVNGATGSHQRFHPEKTLSYKIAYNQEIAFEYNAIAEPMITQILKNQQESRRLAQLRDTLLPRLMSGDLKVNEVDCLSKYA